MKKLIIILLVFASVACWAEENYLSFNFDISLLVFDPEAMQQSILDWVGARGGKFIYRSDNLLQLRIPWKASALFREFLTGLDLDVISFDQNAADLREEIFRLKSGIKSREETLAKNLALISQADVSGTLAIEQEVIRLVSEIERQKGRLGKLEYDRQMAFMAISFNFRQSGRPENVGSSFDWLNRLDMYDFLEGGF
ncbi:MAG: DUF4349 domain-containing protein [Spirochaetales bacterium]|nr:DUF4349 domain-containing protein [Spirochaetales bacterium]